MPSLAPGIHLCLRMYLTQSALNATGREDCGHAHTPLAAGVLRSGREFTPRSRRAYAPPGIHVACRCGGSCLLASLARPGGNVTGLTFFQPELAAKRLEMLKEALPGLRDVGVLLNLANPMNAPAMPQVTEVAQSLKLELHQFDARGQA